MWVLHLSQTAQTIAEYLESHPRMGRVFYPGLKQDRFHQLANKYFSIVDAKDNVHCQYGHLLSFKILKTKVDLADMIA